MSNHTVSFPFAAGAALQSLAAGARLRWHRHDAGYLAVVIAGGYLESGGAGRWRVEPGDVMLHMPFSAHADTVSSRPAQVLNLPLPSSLLQRSATQRKRVSDVDAVIRFAETDIPGALDEVLRQLQPGPSCDVDEIDELAEYLRTASTMSLACWCRQQGIRRETAYRRFVAAYGVSPSQYRVEIRARQAWHDIVTTPAPLIELAARHGFSDQAHMSRDVSRLTGCSPRAWRRAATFLQDSGARSH